MAASISRSKRKRVQESQTSEESDQQVPKLRSIESAVMENGIDRLTNCLLRLQAHLQAKVDAHSNDQKIKRETLNALNAVHSLTGSLVNLIEDLTYHGGAKTNTATNVAKDHSQDAKHRESSSIRDSFAKTELPSLVLCSPVNGGGSISNIPVLPVGSVGALNVSRVPVTPGKIQQHPSRSNATNPSVVMSMVPSVHPSTVMNLKASEGDRDHKQSNPIRTESSVGWEDAFPESLADATTDEEDNVLEEDPADLPPVIHLAPTQQIIESLNRLQAVITHAFPSTKGVHFQEPDSADYH